MTPLLGKPEHTPAAMQDRRRPESSSRSWRAAERHSVILSFGRIKGKAKGARDADPEGGAGTDMTVTSPGRPRPDRGAGGSRLRRLGRMLATLAEACPAIP